MTFRQCCAEAWYDEDDDDPVDAATIVEDDGSGVDWPAVIHKVLCGCYGCLQLPSTIMPNVRVPVETPL